jgi:NDP-sugar pyrophosphorylase family protein
MVLAAGLGTRLRLLTDDRPKALVELCGRTLLGITLSRLRLLGVHDVILNTHHFAGAIAEHLKANDNFGMRLVISHEPNLLDTGGGLKKAAPFFLEDGSREPFMLHNVDVISNFDLAQMIETHRASDALATLAVQDRPSSRALLFNPQGLLRGRAPIASGGAIATDAIARAQDLHSLAFCGIHVLSPRIFSRMHEEGTFSIVTAYLRLAGEGERILAFRNDDAYWQDLGTARALARAAADIDRDASLLPE